jgi:hypothetical protein
VIRGGRLEEMEVITCDSVDDVESVEGVGILAPDQLHFTKTLRGMGAGFFFLTTMIFICAAFVCLEYRQ